MNGVTSSSFTSGDYVRHTGPRSTARDSDFSHTAPKNVRLLFYAYFSPEENSQRRRRGNNKRLLEALTRKPDLQAAARTGDEWCEKSVTITYIHAWRHRPLPLL